MHTLIIKEFPHELGQVSLRQYERDPNIHYVPERDSIVGVGSVHKPDSVRSFTYHFLHLSEVGLWPEKFVISGRNLAQALIGTVQHEPDTMVIIESTGKGRGGYFYEMWQMASEGKSTYEPLFVPWFEHEEYALALDEDELEHVARTLSSYEEMLLEIGATLNQIAWYRAKSSEYSEDFRFKTEYPSTPEEAFATTGRPVFSAKAVLALAYAVRAPTVGELRSSAETGQAALVGIRFEPLERGTLALWRPPGDTLSGLIPPGHKVVHRYCVFLDTGGRTERADYWVATVLDRAWIVFGMPPEVVARWRAHARPDVGAWYAAKLAQYYDEALLAIEVNRFRRSPDFEPDWSLAVIEELREHYGNLYLREEMDKATNVLTQRIGFLTTKYSKAMIIKTLMRAIEEQLYVERDQRAIEEMLAYEYGPDGTMNAPEGAHDDIVVSTAGVLWLSEQMPTPRLIPIAGGKREGAPVSRSPFAARSR
jgi:hypothetical protein